MQDKLEWAKYYAKLGHPVFPCVPGAKVPLTEHGYKDATTDLEQVRRWWTDHPDANIAIATNKLLVFDLDNDRHPWLQDKEIAEALQSAGAISKTPRGWHFLFPMPEGKNWGCSASKLAEGVDVRAPGGYIVVPESIVDGKKYEWVPGRELKLPPNELPALPAKLIELLDNSSTRTQTQSAKRTNIAQSIKPRQQGATPFERVIDALRGAGCDPRQSNSNSRQYTARCPAHDDERPSLSVGEGDDGRVLIHCHADCSPEAVVRALGLTMADLMPQSGDSAQHPPRCPPHAGDCRGPGDNRGLSSKPKDNAKTYATAEEAIQALEKKLGKVAARWPYHNAQGEVVGYVLRWNHRDGKKTIRPVSRAEDGRWVIRHMPEPRPLYRLPELLRAAPQAPIIVCEGEKCADAFRALGFLATTSPGGVSSPHKTNWSPLACREVWIFPDNDAPGRKYAEKVARILTAQAIVSTPIRIVELPGLPEGGDVVDWIAAQGQPIEVLRAEIERLAKATECWQPPKRIDVVQDDDPNDGRPEILITHEERQVNDAAIQALSSAPNIYQRSGQLVRIIKGGPTASGIRRPATPHIDVIPLATLREELATHIRWRKMGRRGIVKTSPPSWCTAAVHARGEWPGIRHLEGVANYPILLPDGTVLKNTGYDQQTGLYLASNCDVTAPDSPTRADALAALDLLFDVVIDFPFASPVHKAAWLAALLTPPARFAFEGPAPLFLVDANVRGSGKGLLLNVISHIVTGEPFTIATYTHDQEELRKRITSLAMAGDAMVLFDNLEGRFGNAVLDAALTATKWKDRVLGGNRIVEVPLHMTWYATGNNVIVGADTARRICHIRLESPEEYPERRQGFKHPRLLDWVRARRSQLLSAVLTILRAYYVAGTPTHGLTPWGSYEGWSLVREVVVWLGLPDPGETRVQLQATADIVAEHMKTILEYLERMDPKRHGLTTNEIINRLSAESSYFGEFRAALEYILPRVDSRQLGILFRKYRRRVFNNRYIDSVSKDHQAQRWAVLSVQTQEASAPSLFHTAPHSPQQLSSPDNEDALDKSPEIANGREAEDREQSDWFGVGDAPAAPSGPPYTGDDVGPYGEGY